MHAQAAVPSGLLWFLGASFFNGVVLEIGRKIRAPEDEEHGVETYSAIWGRTTAVGAWLTAMALAAAAAAVAASRIHFTLPLCVVLGVAFAAAAAVSLSFLRSPVSKTAKLIEHVSALWIICLYLSMGALPRVW